MSSYSGKWVPEKGLVYRMGMEGKYDRNRNQGMSVWTIFSTDRYTILPEIFHTSPKKGLLVAIGIWVPTMFFHGQTDPKAVKTTTNRGT